MGGKTEKSDAGTAEGQVHTHVTDTRDRPA